MHHTVSGAATGQHTTNLQKIKLDCFGEIWCFCEFVAKYFPATKTPNLQNPQKILN
jgi:hypothetical protein